MKRKMKWAGILAGACALACGFGVYNVANVQASAEETASLWTGFAITGAAVRTADPTGLRFKTNVERLTPTMKKYNPDAEYYTTLTLTTASGKTWSTTVEATVWRPDGSGWNTVLLDIPESDYATQVTAQSFVKLNGKEDKFYQTEPVTVSIAQTAAAAVSYGATGTYVQEYYTDIVTSVTLDKASARLEQGQTLQLNATTNPAGYKAKFTSSDSNIASVDAKGKVTAKNVGNATITAEINGYTASCQVNVTAAADLTTYPSYTLTQAEIAALGNATPYNDYQYNSHQFDFYGYSSLTNGTWKEYNAETGELYEVTGEEDYRNVYRIEEYKDAGFTILMPQSSCAVMPADGIDFEFYQSNLKKVMDMALEAGMQKVIVSDYRLYELVVEDSIVGAGKKFATEAELDARVRTYMQGYASHGAFYGVQLPDEPIYTKLASYGQVYRAIKRCYPNAFIQSNLHPCGPNAVSNGVMAEADNATLQKYVNLGYGDHASWYAAFDLYLNSYIDNTGADYIMYDAYPLSDDGVLAQYLGMMQVAANIARERNVEFRFVSQTFTHIKPLNSTNDRLLTQEDLRWLNNMQLGFGIKELAYFTYFTKDANQYEMGLNGGSLITNEGEKTDRYYYLREILAENEKFAPVILSFDYQASATFVSQRQSNNQSYATLFAQGDLAKVQSVSVDKESALVTQLYDKTNSRYMYMLQNLADPTSGACTQTAKIVFNTNYEYAEVWKNGERSVVKLVNNTYVVKQNAGEAVYIIPFNVGITDESGEFVHDFASGDNGAWFPKSENGKSPYEGDEEPGSYIQDSASGDNGAWFPFSDEGTSPWGK